MLAVAWYCCLRHIVCAERKVGRPFLPRVDLRSIDYVRVLWYHILALHNECMQTVPRQSLTMSGLVGYGSSDDEDEDIVPSSTNQPQNAGSALLNGSIRPSFVDGKQLAEAHHLAEGITVGPSMPDNAGATMTDTYEEDAEQGLPPLSERDLIRYLTQPPQPMTSLPPEPTSSADPAVSARFRRFLNFKSNGVHFNEDLASKSSFKNPSLFASLLERSDLSAESQYASTVPSAVFSVDMLPPWAYKEELLTSQRALNDDLEATKKAQSATGKRKIEFTSAGGSQNRERTPNGNYKSLRE